MARKQKKYHYIYKTTCSVNGKYYIGMHSTDNMEDGYLGSGKRLWYSINYHGRDNHIKEILEFCDNREQLKKREEEIVNEQLINENLCMNIKTGGNGGFSSEEHRKKFIETNNWLPSHKRIKWLRENDTKWLEEKKQKIKDGLRKVKFDPKTFLGKKHTEKSKKLISEKNSLNQRGKNNSQYGTCWITNGKENKKIKKESIDEYLIKGWKRGRL